MTTFISFNHPNDSSWIGPKTVRKASHSITSNVLLTRPQYKNVQTSGSVSGIASHSTALLSQSDLFKMCKQETDADAYVSYETRPRQRTKRRSRSRSATSRPYDFRSYLGVQKPDTRTDRDRQNKTCRTVCDSTNLNFNPFNSFSFNDRTSMTRVAFFDRTVVGPTTFVRMTVFVDTLAVPKVKPTKLSVIAYS
jgi:hypothetical protein